MEMNEKIKSSLKRTMTFIEKYFVPILFIGILLVNLFLRVPYVVRPFWFDEVWRANVLSGTPLVESLLSQHRVPIALGLAFLVRAFMFIFGNTEIAIRFITMFSGILIAPVAYIITRKVSNKWAALVVMFFLSVFKPYIDHSIEFKPFTVESLFVLLLLLLLLNLFENLDNRKLLYVLLFFVLVSVFFATPIVFFFPVIFIILFFTYLKKKDKKGLWIICVSALVTGVITILYFLLFLKQQPSEGMYDFWSKGFPKSKDFGTLFVFGKDFLVVIFQKWVLPLTWNFSFINIKESSLVTILVVAFLFGCGILLLKRNWQIVAFLIGTIIVGFVFGVLGVWPIASPRVNLFFYPLFTVISIIGFSEIVNIKYINKLRFILIPILVIGMAGICPRIDIEATRADQLNMHKFYMSGMKDTVSYMKERISPTDNIVVYHPMAREGFTYYYDYYDYSNKDFRGPVEGVDTYFDDTEPRPHRDEEFFKENLKEGERLWIYIIHGMTGKDIGIIRSNAKKFSEQKDHQKFEKVQIYLYESTVSDNSVKIPE